MMTNEQIKKNKVVINWEGEGWVDPETGIGGWIKIEKEEDG